MENPFWFYGKFLALLGVVSLMVCFNFVIWGFHRSPQPLMPQPDNARPERGPALIRHYGCNACHTIAGFTPRPQVGPSLERLPDQLYIAGKLSNTPENLIRWIQQPEKLRPGTAMPNLHVSNEDARDIAAYLLHREPSQPVNATISTEDATR
jgi:cytochrome c2